jgi:hypothetical protein
VRIGECDLPGKSFALPGIRLLARYAKHLLLALPVLFFAAGVEAGGCDGLLGDYSALGEKKINVAASVKVNGLDWEETINSTIRQWRKAFGGKGIVTKVTHNYMGKDTTETELELCTPYHEVTVSYPDKTIRLRIPYLVEYEDIALSEFKTLKFSQNFVKRGSDNLKVLLNIDWKRNRFKDTMVVGEHIISPDLSFDEFKKLFPLSAQQSLGALLLHADMGWHERANETQTYIVEVGRKWVGCLDNAVEFTFFQGKLSGLALRYHGPWCAC